MRARTNPSISARAATPVSDGHIYYDLAPDEALVIETTVPKCRFWNFQLDNWCMESLDYVHRNIWINHAQAKYEADGSVVLVCADRDLGFGNWLDLAGHRTGTAVWRWVEADGHPIPKCRVIKVAEANTLLGQTT